MITEEQISKTVKDYYNKIGKLKGNSMQQILVQKELTAHLHLLYQQNKQQMLDLFWELFLKRSGYYEEIFLAIIAVPHPEANRLASKIMIETNNNLKEDAANYLFDVKDPKSVPNLIESLKSEDYNIVSKSALALGNIGDPSAESHLLKIFRQYDTDEAYSEDRVDDAFPIIRSNTFSALCLLNTPGVQEEILKSALHDRDVGIQFKAIRFLVSEMPMAAPPYLEELSKHKNDKIATLARRYLEEINSSH